MKFWIRCLSIAMIASLGAISGIAQTDSCQGPAEQVLVPVIANEVPGAYGSVWQTYLTITNRSSQAVPVSGGGIPDCGLGLCPTPTIPAESTAVPIGFHRYVVFHCGLDFIDINLRVRDLSRQKETWGTSIPLVHESDFVRGEPLGITDIPSLEGFRSTLRIYTEEGVSGTARVRIFRVQQSGYDPVLKSDVLLEELDVELSPEPLAPLYVSRLLRDDAAERTARG